MSREANADCDVLIVGAGPTGSASAAILAEKGHRVVVLEKETFPRYRIGESLIPYCWHPLQRLGLIEKLDASPFIVRKYSVQFVGTDGRLSTPFYFLDHSDHESSRTWQVVRSDFDQLLVDNAREKGAEVLEGVAARQLLRDGSQVVGVVAEESGGSRREYRARVTLDASGREIFSQRQHGWRRSDPGLKKVAIWTYFKGARRDPGRDEGATTVAYLPEKGWFWYLPLAADVVSVGVVAERDYLYREGSDIDAIFEREVAEQPWIQQRVAAGCKMQPCKITGDFSYRSEHCATDGLVLAGDAFAFLDPVFSSGVYLALQSGVMAADAVDAALDAGDVSAARFDAYGKSLCRQIEAMRRLVYAFYDQSFQFSALLKDHPEFRGDLTDCLIGNLEKDYEPLFKAVAKYAHVPDCLPHGRPQVPARG